MKQNKKLLCVLLSILFLTVPMGIVAFSPTGSTTTLADTAIPASEYDFANRREPINVLVYNEYADLAGAGEYDHTMGELKAEYGYTFEYENLTDHTQLAEMIDDYDVLLLIEQENASYAQMDSVANAWDGFLAGWVDDGGVLICMDHYSPVEGGYHPTARILNNTGLMRIYNSTARIGQSVTITNSFDPLAFGVSAYTGPSGSSSFDTPDGDAIFSTGGQTVVAHRYFGIGHVVMLGFDMFAINPEVRTLLANAVRLTRLAVFDNSHSQFYDPLIGYNDFATDIQTMYGFAIATMNVWDPALVESCQVLVIGTNDGTVIPYDATEVNFIKGFVASGGGLLVTTDVTYWGNTTDPILNGFGFARNQTTSSYYATDSDDNEGNPNQPLYGSDNIANHSATIGVNMIQMMGSTAFTTIPENAKSLVWADTDGTANWAAGLSLVASLNYGSGRVVAFADGQFITDENFDGDGSDDFYDVANENLCRSVMIWLSAAGIEEKTVLFDNSKSPAIALSGFNEFSRFLSFNGFNFMWMNEFYEGLVDQSDILILPDGNDNFTAVEISIIVDFVSRGGGLFVLADNTVFSQQVNPVVAEFGMQYNETGGEIQDSNDYIGAVSYVIYDGDNIANHPIMNGVERIELDLNSGFVTVGSGVSLLSTDTDGTATWGLGGDALGVPVFAATTFNLGRVVAIADYNLPVLGDYDADNYQNLYDSDNDVFLANAFYWLIENRAPIVEVVFPNGGEQLNGTHMVMWTAVDPNGDEMIFDVFVSDNNGSDWSSLASGISGLAFEWNTTLHDDGISYMIRVEASDGMLTGQDESDNPFELDNFVDIPGLPLDPLLLALIGAGVVIIIVVLVILSKKKGGGKKK
jgi:hypothetical protein